MSTLRKDWEIFIGSSNTNIFDTTAWSMAWGKAHFSGTRSIDREWLQHEVMETEEGEAVGKVDGGNDWHTSDTGLGTVVTVNKNSSSGKSKGKDPELWLSRLQVANAHT